MPDEQTKSELTAAIGAHGMWAQMLTEAAQRGDHGLRVADICRDDRCSLGQWLRGPGRHLRGDPHREQVSALHAAFHHEAGEIARMIVAGHESSALRLIADGAFPSRSAELCRALADWQDRL